MTYGGFDERRYTRQLVSRLHDEGAEVRAVLRVQRDSVEDRRFGAAMWGMAPARDVLISEITPEEREGRTFGSLWTGIAFVSAISPAVIGYIGGVGGFRHAFGLLAVALSAVPVLLLFSDRAYLPVERWYEERASD